ncbi:MAG: helix-hairpin-helix domain-containing protein, partial [Flavobacteriaceae bacterium]|nr:helix-hairpin-helix domain-containing protein [Flavobacteriaceae bacterium]
HPSNEMVFSFSSSEIKQVQQQIDSMKILALEEKQHKIYPFNPNFITDYKAYTLGMTPEQFDKLKAFREKDQWVNSKHDFQRVTGVSDSLLEIISSNFKFPDWVSKPKRRPSYFSSEEKTEAQKLDLNTATIEQLQEVYGIGPALSNRIVNFRNKLGSFHHLDELHSVWGLKPEAIAQIEKNFTVRNPRKISEININTSSASDIATVPGINFELAKKIWEFVRLHEGVSSLSELSKIEELTPRKLKLIELYLFAE